MKQPTVGVIGQGFVGGSLTTVLAERGVRVLTYDKAGKVAEGGERRKLLSDVLKEALIVFVCLPTPMKPSGECDVSIVESMLDRMATGRGTVAVVKSTVSPGSTERWNKKLRGGLHIVFSPEFLREATALEDMRNQDRIVLGGPRPWINEVKQLFQWAFPKVPVIKTSSTTAEMVKYFTNVHLASRVVLSCEMMQVCAMLDAAGLNVDYDRVVEIAKYDRRLGGSHMAAPGDEGILGARGHCFPKDLAALVYLAGQLEIEPLLMKAILEKNLALVPPEHRDWEKMIGRAVSAEKQEPQ